ncbi:MAG: hypothetical protein COA50_06050 [Flavobacteriaceae bacterium]|nr:MAG: hypothetical protein COA50_06050 [Flavobacteriaceae bacterium]
MYGQDDGDYIEFNDRRNIVHGVYMGFSGSYGKIDGIDAAFGSFKIAYVANRQLEIGFVATGFYADQNLPNVFQNNKGDLIGGYGGLHLEPIFFGQKKINLSFPILLGSGIVGYIEDTDFDEDFDFDEDIEDWDVAFVIEPGISLLYNISRYAQLELGVKYRFSSEIRLEPESITDINGFSAGFGFKLGVFNLGKNRYKKNINHED